MPTGNITWSDMSPEEKARRMKDKAKSDALSNPQENKGITKPGKVPAPVNMGDKSPVMNSFKSLKAYNTRNKRSVFSG